MSVMEYFSGGLPYVVLVAGLLILMIGVSIRRTHFIAWSLTMLTLGAALAAQIYCFWIIPEGGVEVTDLFVLDGMSYLFNSLFLISAIIVSIFSYEFIESRVHFKEEFYLLLLCATIGSMVLPASVHFISLVLGLEIIGISLYVMVAYPEKERAPLEAGLKYMVLSGVGTAVLLFGMALIYGASGSMEFASTHPPDGSMEGDVLYLIGNAFLWGGIAFKLSLVPFHIWTPDVYHGAPTVVTGFLATISKGAVFAVVLRYVVVGDVLDSGNVLFAVTLLGCASMIIGNLLALLQKNLKRLLAYSSIAHMGYLIVALCIAGTDSSLGYETVLLYLIAYFVMTLAAFGVISVVANKDQSDGDTLESIRGLFWLRPVAGATLIVSALSLAGIPLTLGFIAKFYLFAMGIEGNLWALVSTLVIGSALGIYYYLRIVFATMKKPEDGVSTDQALPWSGVSVLAILGVSLVVLGIYPTPLIELIQSLI